MIQERRLLIRSAKPEYRGHAGVRRFFDDWIENLGAGQRWKTSWGQVYTFRGQQISAVDNYYTASAALEAVGLSDCNRDTAE
jgi:hypothetical protein